MLNERFFHEDSEDYFTLFCGIIEHDKQLLHFCQAGYPKPMIATSHGEIREIGEGGYPVALLPDVHFNTETTELTVDETLVVFSDGATEAEDENEVAFGTKRLSAAIQNACSNDVATIPNTIVAALRDWRGQRALDDDLTVLVCQRRHPE